jgi:hypothetical protein
VILDNVVVLFIVAGVNIIILHSGSNVTEEFVLVVFLKLVGNLDEEGSGSAVATCVVGRTMVNETGLVTLDLALSLLVSFSMLGVPFTQNSSDVSVNDPFNDL